MEAAGRALFLTLAVTMCAAWYSAGKHAGIAMGFAASGDIGISVPSLPAGSVISFTSPESKYSLTIGEGRIGCSK